MQAAAGDGSRLSLDALAWVDGIRGWLVQLSGQLFRGPSTAPFCYEDPLALTLELHTCHTQMREHSGSTLPCNLTCLQGGGHEQ